MMKSKKISNRDKVFKMKVLSARLRYVILILFAAIVIFPLFYVISISLQSFQEVSKFPPTIVPQVPKFTNYVTLFNMGHFSRFLLNSFIFAGSLTISHMFFSSLAGYVLAKFEFPFKKTITLLVLISMMFPVNMRAIPLYTLIVKLRLAGTYTGLIIPFLTGGFTIFIMRQYIVSAIPDAFIDAARLDGSSEFKIFWTIVLPLAKPALAVVAILQFVLRWNMFLWPLIVARGELKTLPVALAGLKESERFVQWNIIGAGCVFLIIPTLILFLIFQRFIISQTGGGLKF